MSKPFPLTLKHVTARGALALLSALFVAHALAATARAQKESPASVAGRVTDGDHGVAGVTVMLLSNDPAQRFKAIARAKTDADGRYQMMNVAPGRYQVMPYAPVYVVQGASDSWPPGTPLTLLPGDEVRDVDFRVERGGVIMGRVTDADGNPVIAELVTLMPIDSTQTQLPRRGPFDTRDLMTDDRGVYRLYGLAAGHYRVAVGQSSDEMGAVAVGRRKIFKRTYYPDVTDAAQARAVEVKTGDETTDVDITLGRALKTYRASGRFVSAETGQPMPNVVFGYGTLDPSGRGVASFGGGSMATNTRGEFQTEGLAPGRYAVFSYPSQEGSEFYSDLVRFDVADADVTGLVVQMKRGASVSGVVQIEGMSDRAAAARMLTQVRLYSYVDQSGQQGLPTFTPPPTVAPDGSFRIGGLHPGNLRLGAAGEAAKGLSLVGVEMNGAPVTGGIPVTEGAQITGVRLRMVYGSAIIRGQINFVNGTLPPGMRIIASARRAGAVGTEGGIGRQVEADVRGFFRVEGLPAGEYEVVVRVFGAGRVGMSDRQHVSLAEGGEVSVSPTVDLSKLTSPNVYVVPGNR
ncbi:MAG: hypothetical protein QOJ70_453 [Acidobacteriota bacterium]|jgi:hypothetical protein|nr:hypothetical protein [Acidobacteriota bacterium]